MKTNLLTYFVALLTAVSAFLPSDLSAQTAPYALSPRWIFGNKGYFDFTGGALAQPARTDNIIANEGSSTLCDSLKAVAVYDNNVRIAGNNFVPNGTPMVNSSSSTQGGVIIPDPSNIYGRFFIIVGNAESAYTAHEPNDLVKQGLSVYRTTKTPTSVTAPTLISNLEADPNVREYAYASSDGDYGYWVISARVSGGGNTSFYAWPIPASGAVGARVTSNGATGIWNEQYQGAIKVNRCQTMIALAQGSSIQIYEWDRNTGMVGAELVKYINGSPSSKYYGIEFSPSGNYLYASTLDASPITRITVASGAVTTLGGGNASGSLQLGPNNVIYVANGLDGSNSSNVGTITTPDAGGTYNPTGVALANSSTTRLGISNIAWINPRKPRPIPTLNSCGNYTFTPEFLTYFKDVISYNKAVWNFGDGSPTVTNNGAAADDPVNHIYTSNGNKTITLTLTDATCSQDWVGTLTINVPCSLPVELINFSGSYEEPSNSVTLHWATLTEENNQYFEIQRSSDGINFTSIGTVNGEGNSQQLSEYTFYDTAPIANASNYYRLIQHDYDGKTEESNIISVKTGGADFSVYPNPSEEEFTLKPGTKGNISISVYTVLGVEIYKTTLMNAPSTLSFGKDFSRGYYILKYTDESGSKTVKLEKK